VAFVRALLSISRLIDTITGFAGKLISVAVIALVLLGVFNVVTRYLGPYVGRNLYTQGAAELQNILFTFVFLLGFSYILRKNGNVRVDFMYANWGDKRKALVNLVGNVLFLIPFCILAITRGYPLAERTFRTGETSGNAGGLQIYPYWFLFVIGLSLLLLQAISDTIKHAAVLADANDLSAHDAEVYEAKPVE
jgi:TRAP-type mannitol/chloroaromatic compound transport system permease small subunit